MTLVDRLHLDDLLRFVRALILAQAVSITVVGRHVWICTRSHRVIVSQIIQTAALFTVLPRIRLPSTAHGLIARSIALPRAIVRDEDHRQGHVRVVARALEIVEKLLVHEMIEHEPCDILVEARVT